MLTKASLKLDCRTDCGCSLWLLGSCSDILVPALVPGRPLTKSHMRPGLWTHSPWGCSLSHPGRQPTPSALRSACVWGTRGSSAPCPSPACLDPPNILSRDLQGVVGRGSGTRADPSSLLGSASSCAPGPAPSGAASCARAAPPRSSCPAGGPLSTGAPRHSWV